MTKPATHIFRLLKWGRTLARHGALRGIENDPNTPGPVKRLARLARFGTFQPRQPDYAGAFSAIGPAAIKLGQSLATRPDLVGEDAARNLLALQDSLPPVPFGEIEQAIAASFGQPVETLFERIDPVPVGAASIAQVHRAVTTDGRQVALKVLRPGIRERFARDIQTYEWAAAHLEALGGEAARLRPRLTIANFKRWTNRELDLRREAASASELAEAMHGVERYHIPQVDWDRTNGRVMTVEWVDGIKISDRDALVAAGHDLPDLEGLALVTYRESFGGFVDSSAQYWATPSLRARNELWIHPTTADEVEGAEDGRLTVSVGGRHQQVHVKATEGIRPGVVAAAVGYGHHEGYDGATTIDGETVLPDPRRTLGFDAGSLRDDREPLTTSPADREPRRTLAELLAAKPGSCDRL